MGVDQILLAPAQSVRRRPRRSVDSHARWASAQASIGGPFLLSEVRF